MWVQITLFVLGIIARHQKAQTEQERQQVLEKGLEEGLRYVPEDKRKDLQRTLLAISAAPQSDIEREGLEVIGDFIGDIGRLLLGGK